jgi:hypothetical protein
MNWSQYGPAALAAFLAISVTDGLFFGLLMRGSGGLRRPWIDGHRLAAFVLARIGAVLTALVFLFMCGFFGLSSLQPAVMFAIGSWIAIVVPLVAQAGLYLKLGWALIVAQLLGWLARLLACAAAAYYFL